MNTKKCISCSETNLLMFAKRKANKDGYQKKCRKCQKASVVAYQKTKKGLATRIYASQCSSSKRRGHNAPSYSKEEFSKWLFNQAIFLKLYNEWVASGYDKMLVPSVDRKRDEEGYNFSNIQLMTWEQNFIKGNQDQKTGKLNNGTVLRAVFQYSKDNDFIAEHISVSEAGRTTKTSTSDISKCCKGKQNIAGGFRWEYKDGNN